eukprot:maker-scaffold_8-snap-gene-6.13-mRNA-1 protein AED:0.07 eAED:0.07 QI:256/1/1/1/1/1/2/287/416
MNKPISMLASAPSFSKVKAEKRSKPTLLVSVVSFLFIISSGITLSVTSPERAKHAEATEESVSTNLDENGECIYPVGELIDFGYISLVFTACPSTASFEAFSSAADRWSNIIIENKIEAQSWPSTFEVNKVCSFLSDFTFQHPNTEETKFELDHLLIFAEVRPIDGRGSTLASAGPCFIDTLSNYFPIVGGMLFDSADLEALESAGTLETVVLHEMAHTLGLGTLWRSVQQNGGYTYDNRKLLIQDPIFDSDYNANLNHVPYFTGENAIHAYGELTGMNEESVPVEDGRLNGEFYYFDPSKKQGIGSVDSHFKIEDFKTELMVFAIDSSKSYSLSSVTLGSLADLGYAVDMSLADELESLKQLSMQSSLRSSGIDSVEEESGEVFLMENDIIGTYGVGFGEIKTAEEVRLLLDLEN